MKAWTAAFLLFACLLPDVLEAANRAGDANNDKVVANMADAVRTQGGLLGTVSPTQVSPLALVGGDNNVGIDDVMLIAQRATAVRAVISPQIGVVSTVPPSSSSFAHLSPPVLRSFQVVSSAVSAQMVDGLDALSFVIAEGASVESTLSFPSSAVAGGLASVTLNPNNPALPDDSVTTQLFFSLRTSSGTLQGLVLNEVIDTVAAPFCGDSVVQPGEGCDDGVGGACFDDCSGANVCGDMVVFAGETCDDGDTDNCTLPCNATCSGPHTVACGEGTQECGEACDDGNMVSGDGCSSVCLSETDICAMSVTDVMGGAALGVFQVGSLLYVAKGMVGLEIYDLSGPGDPVLLGRVNTPGEAREVIVSGTLAYVADGPGAIGYIPAGGLVIVDVTNPAAPVIVGQNPDEPFGGDSQDVALVGNTLYLAQSGESGFGAGVEIYNVANPASPVRTGSLALPGGYAYESFGVTAVGGYLYVAVTASNTNAKDLYIFDLATPTAPVGVGSLDLEGAPWAPNLRDVSVTGTTAVTLNAYRQVRTVNVGVPSTPTALGSLSLGGDEARRIEAVGSRAYVAVSASTGSANGVYVVDIGTPATPTLMGSYAAAGSSRDVAVSGSALWWADYQRGVTALDVTTPATPVVTGRVETISSSKSAASSGTRLYVTDGAGGLKVVRLDGPGAPRISGSYLPPTGSLYDLQVVSNRAYASDSSNLLILDLTVPDAPTLLGSYANVGGIYAFTVVGTRAYIASCNLGVKIVDVTTPAAPTLLGSYDIAGIFDCAIDVAVAGATAYIAYQEDGLRLVDVSTPATPMLLGIYATAYAMSVEASGGYAYVGDAISEWIDKVDVSVPATPTWVGRWSEAFFTPAGMRLDGNDLYVWVSQTYYNSRLRILDVSGAAPVLEASLPGYWYSLGQPAPVSPWVWLPGDQQGLFRVGDAPAFCAAQCGNKTSEYPEACDDGNHNNGDGCNSACTGP